MAAEAKKDFFQKVGKYTLEVSFQEETQDTIEDRVLLLARRKMQLMEMGETDEGAIAVSCGHVSSPES